MFLVHLGPACFIWTWDLFAAMNHRISRWAVHVVERAALCKEPHLHSHSRPLLGAPAGDSWRRLHLSEQLERPRRAEPSPPNLLLPHVLATVRDDDGAAAPTCWRLLVPPSPGSSEHLYYCLCMILNQNLMGACQSRLQDLMKESQPAFSFKMNFFHLKASLWSHSSFDCFVLSTQSNEIIFCLEKLGSICLH